MVSVYTRSYRVRVELWLLALSSSSKEQVNILFGHHLSRFCIGTKVGAEFRTGEALNTKKLAPKERVYPPQTLEGLNTIYSKISGKLV